MQNFENVTFSMKKQREALEKSRKQKKVVTKIHSETITINHNNYIQQNFIPNTTIQRIDAQTSPIPHPHNRYPLLGEMVNNASRRLNGRRWTMAFVIFATLLYFYSPTAYSILKGQMPLPTVSTVYRNKNSLLLDQSENLLSIEKLPEIMKIYEESNLFNTSASNRIKGIIAVDAVSIVPSNKIFKNGTFSGILSNINISDYEINEISNSYKKFEDLIVNNSKNIIKSAFVFQFQPVNHSIPCFLIHIIPSNTGKANQNIVSKLFELKKYN